MLCTDDESLAKRVRANACFGMESAFARQSADGLAIPEFTSLGYNYKLSDVLAAIALVQLGKLTKFGDRRRAIAARYFEMLDIPGIIPPTIPAGRVPAWQTYAVMVQEPLDRDAIAVALRAEGIGCNIGTYAMHLQSVYGSATRPCPVSKRLLRQHLAIPMYTDMTDADQDRVVETLRQDIGRWCRRVQHAWCLARLSLVAVDSDGGRSQWSPVTWSCVGLMRQLS